MESLTVIIIVGCVGGTLVLANFIVCIIWKLKHKGEMETELETETDKVEPNQIIDEK